MRNLAARFNKHRVQQYFSNPLFSTRKKYACVGVGMHSLSTIYPIFRHFNIIPAYICTRNSDRRHEISLLFPGSKCTNNINDIIDDPAIDAVFVSASPAEHFVIVHSLLKAGKKIFVEKPPCLTADELEQLIQADPRGVCRVGLQRRFWPGNKQLLRKSASALSYLYRFHFGAYIQGDPITELFIHAIDYSHFIFGEFTLLSATRQATSEGLALQLHVRHSSGVAGFLDLSTCNSWKEPVEEIAIQCKSEVLHASYPLSLKGEQKPRRFLHLPSERLLGSDSVTHGYFSAGRLIVPAQDQNTLFLQGFYGEIESFIRSVENVDADKSPYDLPSLRSFYSLCEALKRST